MENFSLNQILLNKYFIEFMENFILILVILSTGNLMYTSIVLICCIYLAGAITTGNPAVILALFLAKKISINECFYYIIAEIMGCLLGYLIYNLFLKKK